MNTEDSGCYERKAEVSNHHAGDQEQEHLPRMQGVWNLADLVLSVEQGISRAWDEGVGGKRTEAAHAQSG
ncbi:hypothetical protein D3C73_1442910 [compost metagenome]